MYPELEPWAKNELIKITSHLRELGYQIRPGLKPPQIIAQKPGETVDITIELFKECVMFNSLWQCSDYARTNFIKYLEIVNQLNLDSLAVQFCVNYMGALSMTLFHFGLYTRDSFNTFYKTWKTDIDKLWFSETRLIYLV